MREPPTNICPLLAIANRGTSSGPAVCLKERCAFWHTELDPMTKETIGKCALISISDSLAKIHRYGIG